MSYVEYSSNNSGGRWWLKDDDWRALEAAGWKVVWKTHETVYSDEGGYVYDDDGTPKLQPQTGPFGPDKDGRWLGALATSAFRSGLSLREAADEWERVTGKSATDAGCPCCGTPHNFTEYDDNGKYVSSGPESSYSASW